MGKQTKKIMVKILDELFRWMKNTGVCEAASRESLEKENSCLQINTKFKSSEG